MVQIKLILEKGKSYGVGDNTSGQLGEKELQPFYSVVTTNPNYDLVIKKISAGFQHSLLLSEDGEVFGCGKCDKMQLGEDYLEKYKSHPTFRDEGIGLVKLNLKDIEGKIIDIAAGKYHSAFLTGSLLLISVRHRKCLYHRRKPIRSAWRIQPE